MASQQTDTQTDNTKGNPISISLPDKIDAEMKKIEDCMKVFRTTLTSLKSFKNEFNKMEKKLQKELKKRKKRTSENSSNTGFKAYKPITKRLSLFIRDHLVEVMEERIKECEKGLKDPDSLTNKQLEKFTKDIERYPTWLKDVVEKFTYENDWENEWPRTAITTVLARYVEYHSLKDPEAPSYILVDKPAGKNLNKILDNFSNDDKLRYMNIQTYIKLNILTNARKKELENFKKNGEAAAETKEEKSSETPSSKLKKTVKKKKTKKSSSTTSKKTVKA